MFCVCVCVCMYVCKRERRTLELVPPLRRDMLVVFFVFFFRCVPLRLFVPVYVVVVVVSVCVCVSSRTIP